jgi:hypothetical protein
MDLAQAMAAFEQWTQLPEAEQEPFLRKLDPALRPLVERLIQAQHNAEVRSFLLTPSAVKPTLAGTMLGEWRVEAQLGAKVWLGARGEERAALRLRALPPQLATAHPNVARVLDQGAGYIAVEFIEGEELQPRSELLFQVCEAAIHLREQGVEPGELKALVTRDGQVKLLDPASAPTVQSVARLAGVEASSLEELRDGLRPKGILYKLRKLFG